VTSSPARPTVDVGIVTWNTAGLTAAALTHLRQSDQGCDLRVLVHDNGSSDGTPEAVALADPAAEIEVSSANLGFARAVNRLVARSSAPWFLALNSDAWPEPGAIGAMVAAAQAHPEAGAIAPLLLRPDGSQEHSTHPFPSLLIASVDALGGRRWLPRRWLDQLQLQGAWRQDRPRTVDWAVGAALLFRRKALEAVGGLDETFFIYVEDLEWCWRARRKGWSIHFDPTATVRHVGNASGEKRFGSKRLAVESTNLRLFLRRERGRGFEAAYRSLRILALARETFVARKRRAPEYGYWKESLKLELDLSPPLHLYPPSPTDAAALDAPRVAVVVSTRDRAERLPRLIAALQAQTLAKSEFEVVMVDDGSVDGTPEVLERARRQGGLRLTTLRTSGLGPAAGRNLGWRSTDCAVVAFTDDDCQPGSGWLQAGLAALGPAGKVVVGRTCPPPAGWL
jgi:N-acetylglucosaminyl-diphospho-decaprenol L-rhamnosyltransferase